MHQWSHPYPEFLSGNKKLIFIDLKGREEREGEVKREENVRGKEGMGETEGTERERLQLPVILELHRPGVQEPKSLKPSFDASKGLYWQEIKTGTRTHELWYGIQAPKYILDTAPLHFKGKHFKLYIQLLY